MDLPFHRFVIITEIIDSATERQMKDDLTVAAYTAWQIGLFLGADIPRQFDRYIYRLGLLKEKPQRRINKDDALRKAAKIVELDKRRQ